MEHLTTLEYALSGVLADSEALWSTGAETAAAQHHLTLYTGPYSKRLTHNSHLLFFN